LAKNTLSIILLSLLILIAASPFSLCKEKIKYKKRKINVTTAYVKKGKLVIRAFLTGRSRYAFTTNIRPLAQGRIVKLNFVEGDFVKKDSIIAKIDDRYIKLQKKSLLFQLKKIEQNINKLQKNYEIAKKKFLNTLNLAKNEVELKKQNYEKIKKGARTEELEEAREKLNQAKFAFENAESNFHRIKNLYKKQSISPQTYDDALSRFQQAKAQFYAMRARYALLKKGNRPEDIAQAKIALKLAKLKLENTKLEKESVETMKIDIRIAEASRLELLNKLEEIDEKIKDTYVIAPYNGILSDRKVAPGEFVTSGNIIFKLSSTIQEAELVVPEKYISKLYKKQKAKFYFPYIEKTVPGWIAKIVPVKSQLTGRYTAIARFDKVIKNFADGLFCKCSVIVEEKEDVLKLPIDAIITYENKDYVFKVIKQNNKYFVKQIRIITGLKTINEIEILSNNLKPKDKIVIEGKDVLQESDEVNIIGEHK